MLSDSEQRRLAEIESAMRANDPAFARRFTAWQSRGRTRRVLTPLALAGAVIGMVAGLAARSAIGFLIGFLVVGAAAAITVRHRY